MSRKHVFKTNPTSDMEVAGIVYQLYENFKEEIQKLEAMRREMHEIKNPDQKLIEIHGENTTERALITISLDPLNVNGEQGLQNLIYRKEIELIKKIKAFLEGEFWKIQASFLEEKQNS